MILRHPRVTEDPEVRSAHAEDASGLRLVPEGVARPRDERDVVEIVLACCANRVPLTAQGARTGTVGAGIADAGLVLSMTAFDRVVDVDPVRRRAVVQPGVLLGDLQRQLAPLGLHFPPDPTSENECTVGGAVAANASGPRTYAFGPARPWVDGLAVVLGGGETARFSRCRASKNAAGFGGLADPVDLFVGSEGTLGIVTELTLALRPLPEEVLAAVAFFPSLARAVDFVLAADAARRAGTHAPRCLELFDDGSLALVRAAAPGAGVPPSARAAILLEEEHAAGGDGAVVERWLPLVERCGGSADDTLVARDEARRRALRELRHLLPATMNERGARARAGGGGKVSTDWAVPLSELAAALDEATELAGRLFGGEFIRYGHAGNGHPHVNLLADDAASLPRARDAARAMALAAIRRGGTVSAEHGIGKVKRDLFAQQVPSFVRRAMRGAKRALDPAGILAPGNLFA